MGGPLGHRDVGACFYPARLPHSPTRNDNGEDGGATKDSLYTLIDYLDPMATRHVHEAHLRNLRKSCRRRVRQDRAGLPRRRNRLHGRYPLDPQAARNISKGKRLRLETLHPPDLRRQNDARGATRQGRLLGRVERHVPRQFLQATARLVQRAEHGIHGPPEP